MTEIPNVYDLDVEGYLNLAAEEIIAELATHEARGWHVTRYSMYNALRGIFADKATPEHRTLMVSHSAALRQETGLDGTRSFAANYPKYNFMDLDLPDDSYDFVISDQVLEHLEGNPQNAFDETYRVLKPGGYFVHTTCLVHPVHGAPGDFWRFTIYGLAHLAKRFEDVTTGSWGNLSAMRMITKKCRFEGVPHDRRHPLHRIAIQNQRDWPIVTWIYGRKPGGEE